MGASLRLLRYRPQTGLAESNKATPRFEPTISSSRRFPRRAILGKVDVLRSRTPGPLRMLCAALPILESGKVTREPREFRVQNGDLRYVEIRPRRGIAVNALAFAAELR